MTVEKKKINVKEHMSDNLIDLSLTGISEIPVKEIAALRRATILDLSSNSIVGLGKLFATLTHIVQLNLSKNQIKFLPEDFGNLTNLRHLDLYNNKIEHLPLSFGHLKKLRYLDLKGNPLKPALQPVVGKCLTNKDCMDASRKTVAFMAELEIQVVEEKRKDEEKKKLREAAEAEALKKDEAAKKKATKKEKSQKTKKQANHQDNKVKTQVADAANGYKKSAKVENIVEDASSSDEGVISCWKTFYLVFLTLVIFYFVIFNSTVFNFLSQYLSPEDVTGISYRRQIIREYLERQYDNLLDRLSFNRN